MPILFFVCIFFSLLVRAIDKEYLFLVAHAWVSSFLVLPSSLYTNGMTDVVDHSLVSALSMDAVQVAAFLDCKIQADERFLDDYFQPNPVEKYFESADVPNVDLKTYAKR